jgi:hypothetical protein
MATEDSSDATRAPQMTHRGYADSPPVFGPAPNPSSSAINRNSKTTCGLRPA